MTTTEQPRGGGTASTDATGSDGRTDSRSRGLSLRAVGFFLTLVVTIALFLLLIGDYLLFGFTAWTPRGAELVGVHQFHDAVFPMMLGIALLGLVIQLYRPIDRIVGVIGFLFVVGLLGAIEAVSVSRGLMPAEDLILASLFGGLGLVVAVLHPASGSIRRPRSGERIDPIVGGLVAVAAIPLLLYFFDQATLQTTGSSDDLHVVLGHYAAMATVAGSILVLGLIAVLAPVGWRIAAVGAGLIALLWGGASVAFPTLPSSGGLVWGALATLWAVAFVAAAEYAHRGDVTGDVSSPETPGSA